MQEQITITWIKCADKLPKSKKTLIAFKVKDSNRFAFGYYSKNIRYPWIETCLDDTVNSEWSNDAVTMWCYTSDLIK